MAEVLNPADSSSLQAERGPVNMAVAGAMVFEPGEGTSYDKVAQRLAERIHLVPRYRQKLADPAFGLSNPVWVDDAGFDLHWHLRSGTLPAPGGRRELEDYIAREMSRKLDRERPLWELHVVEGYDGGRRVLLPKMHHALVDGLAAIGIGMVLLDPTPEPMPIAPPEEGWQPKSFDRRRHLAKLAAQPLARAQKLLLDSTVRALETSPRRAAEELYSATQLAAELARQRPQAPMTPLNHGISPNRRFATAVAGLEQLKLVARGHDGTINDVVLAIVTGMISRYLAAAGIEIGSRPPVALVPVSVRKEGDTQMGNRISMVFVDLPTHLEGTDARIRAINRQTTQLKGSAAVRAGSLIAGASGQIPPLVSSMIVRAMGSVRGMNLVVSNIPGPQQPFFMNGVRLLEAYPAVPLNPANQGLSVGVISYDGRVCFGVLGDAALEPRVEVAAEALRMSLEEVLG